MSEEQDPFGRVDDVDAVEEDDELEEQRHEVAKSIAKSSTPSARPLGHRQYRDHGSIETVATMIAAKLDTELALIPADQIEDLEVDPEAFTRNRPQEGFVRLPTLVITECPEKPGHTIWWYAAIVTDKGDFYFEGMRSTNAYLLAQRFNSPGRGSAGDLRVDDAGVAEIPETRALAAMPDDVDGPLFRRALMDETFAGLPVADLAKWVLLEQWQMRTHPDYQKFAMSSQGWKPSEVGGLYPGGSNPGGIY